MDDVSVVVKKVWGTWEELILGGAVLRHGTGDWDVISSELRTRTVYPLYFTPEACRARYEDLQQRFTGSKYWYDELRERRVAELKQALEKSEESIGLLVSKLENLKAEKGHCDQINYDSSQTESPPQSLPNTNTVTIKSIQKHVSKEEFEPSAGSFTQDLEPNPQPKSHSPSLDSPEVKPEVRESCMIRKQRGKRKRKDGNWDVKDGIVESENPGSSSGIRRDETSTSSGCVRSSGADGEGPQFDDLVGIFNSVTENQYALVFRRRLDSQKRARYRNTIKQHMDLDTVKSRIANNCIKSTRELFKDLLLLANNALVFYSKRTREYQSALTLRGIVTKRYKELLTDSNSSNSKPLSSSILCFPSMSTPVRPRSVRPRAPCKQPKLVVKFPTSSPMAGPHGYLKLSSNSSSSTLNPETEGCKKSNVDSLGAADPKTVKRGLGRPRRVGGGGRGGKQPPAPPRNCTNQKKTHQK
ncbi:putative transcription factor MYB-related family [Helianthus annuus]|nr:putative transcription factor MYB-related family [Helianthus annuus]